MHILGVPEREDMEKGTESILKIITERWKCKSMKLKEPQLDSTQRGLLQSTL
jgi:hypothetical protein